MGFGCKCGYAWKGMMPETREHEGEYLTLIERERWMDEAAGAIASFAAASASGRRDQWLDESEYFNSQYPRDLPDAEVIHDILFASRMAKGVDVYRCPRCRRIYIQERPGENRWSEYRHVEEDGPS